MDGCRCSQCFGLREYMLNVTGRDYGLAPAPGHGRPTAAVTQQLDDPCDGSMTCRCAKCQAAVSTLVRRGGQGGGWQPWSAGEKAA